MNVVKRIEIITGPQEFRQVIDVLETSGVTGYAVLSQVLGKGDKKVNSWDSLTGEIQNLMVVTTIQSEMLQLLVESLRPVLKRFGGSCLVSDAMWVIH